MGRLYEEPFISVKRFDSDDMITIASANSINGYSAQNFYTTNQMQGEVLAGETAVNAIVGYQYTTTAQ